MKDMKKKINQYLLTICAIFVAVVGDGQFEQGQYEFHDQLYQRTRKVDYR